MSTAKHSPTPWRRGKSNNRSPAVRDADGHLVAVVNVNTNTEVRLGNQCLLVAAPDLLAVLRDAEAFIAGFEDDANQEGVADILRRITTAIARAEGGVS